MVKRCQAWPAGGSTTVGIRRDFTIDIDVNSRDAPSSQDDWYLDTERR